MHPNPRRRDASFGEAKTGVEREAGGRFAAVPKCDFCGKPITGEHYSDTRVCGNSDGPGFYLCDRKRCMGAREAFEKHEGLDALAAHYTRQRALNDGLAPNARGDLAPGEHLETRHVLAGAYRGRQEERVTLTHAVVVDADERSVRTLCRQPVDRMGDTYGESAEELVMPPTCPRCLERWTKLQRHTPNARHSNHRTVVEYAVQEMFKGKSPKVAAENTARKLNGGTNMFIDTVNETDIDPIELEEALWNNMADYAVKGSRPGHETGAAKGALMHFNQWQWGKPPKLKMEQKLLALMQARSVPEHTPNATVYYVWVLDYHGVPINEGPYGPYNLTAGKQYARIGATEGEHDRAVSVGRDPESSGFEIIRRYRRGTGEQVL